MSFKVYIEMPAGAQSEPHDFEEEAEAMKLFDRFVGQMRPWKGFHADVVMIENKKVIQLEQIRNA